MKIGIYSPLYPGAGAPCGVGTYTRNLANGLYDLGHELHVLTIGSQSRVCRDNRVTIHAQTANYFPVIERFLPGSGSCYRIGRAMLRLAASQQLDIVEFANWEGLGLWFALGRSVPMVVRLHTSSQEAHTIDGRSIRGPVKWDVRREGWQARMADALVTHSVAHQREMANELGIDQDRIAVIPHGVVAYPRFQRPQSSGTELNVVFLGRLEARKGAVDLLRAIPRILAAVPQVRFTLIGKDRNHCPGNRTHAQYLRDELPPNVQARIHLAGQLPDDEVNRLLQTADVFVAPSLYESFGLVFLEAMRWGTCVIGTDTGGIPEVVKHGETGLLVRPQSPKELANALISLLKDPARRRALGEAARKRVESRFTVERMAQQVGCLYEDVIKEWKLKSRRKPTWNSMRSEGTTTRLLQEQHVNE